MSDYYTIARLYQDDVDVTDDHTQLAWPDNHLSTGAFRSQGLCFREGAFWAATRRTFQVNARAFFAGDDAGSRLLYATIELVGRRPEPNDALFPLALHNKKPISAGGGDLQVAGLVMLPEFAKLRFYVGQEDAEGDVTATVMADIWEV